MDKISFHMASFPPRERSLEETVNTILPQCDELHIYLNGYKQVPKFLLHPKITVYRSQQEIGDLGDVGKFYNCENWEGYCFTVDDKILYPKDYVKTMIDAIEKYGRRAVISLHGRIVKPKCTSYYHDFKKAFRCLDTVMQNEFTHVVGTGVLAWHSDTFKLDFSTFETSNMSDIWFSIALQKEMIPGVILKHRARWIKLSNLQDNRVSISAACSNNDQVQTDIVNSIDWILSCPFKL